MGQMTRDLHSMLDPYMQNLWPFSILGAELKHSISLQLEFSYFAPPAPVSFVELYVSFCCYFTLLLHATESEIPHVPQKYNYNVDFRVLFFFTESKILLPQHT